MRGDALYRRSAQPDQQRTPAINTAFTLINEHAERQSAASPRAACRDLMISTILIADDDPVQRRLLEAMGRRFGYATEVVDSGEAALARLEAAGQASIDLLILDLVMPDLDGMAFSAACVSAR